MRGYISCFADDDAGKLAFFKEEDKEICKIDRKDSTIFKLIDYKNVNCIDLITRKENNVNINLC
ncbi:hypothetical protein AGMMS50284_2630 [Clostridia bacterium]|nr:hypothetical protein AGMMS50284_2420 [Clostridia bacterium]GHU81854.1 hypothetical protein AGMMS50284_2630 [Clostridia bacterium]